MRRLLINPLVTALLVTATIDDAHAARQVAIFPSTGDVCLDPDSVDAVVKALSVPAGSAITLIAYSDATDVRRGMKLNESCLSRKIPKGISGHLRVAAARALSVYEAANKAGTPGFDAPPVFQIALGEAEVSTNPGVVTLIAKRAGAYDEYSRRVDLVAHAVPPTPPEKVADVVVKPSRIHIDGQPVVDELARRRANTPRILRAIGWTELGLGMGVAALGSVFLVNGATQHEVAADTIDPERAALLEADGYQYIRTGGWAIAVGSGLLIGGIATLAIARRLGKKSEARSKRLAFDGRRIVVRW